MREFSIHQATAHSMIKKVLRERVVNLPDYGEIYPAITRARENEAVLDLLHSCMVRKYGKEGRRFKDLLDFWKWFKECWQDIRPLILTLVQFIEGQSNGGNHDAYNERKRESRETSLRPA